MNFLSLEYYIFLFSIVILYHVAKAKYRSIILIISSYFLYIYWNKYDVFYLIFITILIFILSILMEKASHKKAKKIYFYLGLSVTIGIVLFFKFKRVLSPDTMNRDLHSISAIASYLPLGFSFYTFTALSYFIDIYRAKIRIEKNIFIFFTYITFFPKLIAGPIERASYLIPQFKAKLNFNQSEIISGVGLIIIGLFKKLVIADTLRPLCFIVFGEINFFYGLPFFLATFLVSYVIYVDMFAYTDIARGSAKLFGIELSQNFKQPFLAQSPAEYWRRYHITLVRWFWNYVFLALCKKHSSLKAIRINLFLTFVLVGMWHGTDRWHLLWGVFHGLIYLTYGFVLNYPTKVLDKYIRFECIKATIRCAITQIILVFPLLITYLGRINSFTNQPLMPFLKNSFSDFLNLKSLIYFFDNYYSLSNLVIICSFFVLMEILYFLNNKTSLVTLFRLTNPLVRTAVYFIFLLIIIIFGNFSLETFVYFQY